jgi:hypothetical protein
MTTSDRHCKSLDPTHSSPAPTVNLYLFLPPLNTSSEFSTSFQKKLGKKLKTLFMNTRKRSLKGALYGHPLCAWYAKGAHGKMLQIWYGGLFTHFRSHLWWLQSFAILACSQWSICSDQWTMLTRPSVDPGSQLLIEEDLWMIVDKVWKSTNTGNLRLDPRSSHAQRKPNFLYSRINVCSYSPRHVVITHLWVAFFLTFSFNLSQSRVP